MLEQGKERSMFGCNFTSHRNVWIYSLDTPSVRKEIENRMSIELQGEEIPVRKRFSNWVHENYRSILTTKQIAYVEATEEERFTKYTKRDRWKYKNVIQRTLLRKYFNMDGMQYYRRLEYDLEKLNILRKLRRKAYDNKAFVSYILDNLDTNYINELVYGTRISTKAFKHLMYARLNPDYTPNAAILNELYDLIMEDIEATKLRIFSYKSN